MLTGEWLNEVDFKNQIWLNNKMPINKLINEAQELFDKGDFVASSIKIENIIKIDNNNAKSYELLAYIKANTGHMDEAYRLLLKACSTDNASGEAYYYLGKIQLEKNNYQEAVISFRKSISKSGYFFEGLVDIGIALSCLGKNTEAETNFENAKKINNKNPNIYYNIAKLKDKLLKYNEAIDNYNYAIEIYPEFTDAWLKKAETLCNIKKYDEALSCINKAYELDSNNIQTLLIIGILLNKLGKYKEAISIYNESLIIDKTNTIALHNKTISLIRLKDYLNAMKTCEENISLSPNSSEAYLNKGIIAVYLNNIEESLIYFDQSIALNNKIPNAYVSKAEALNHLGRFTEAINCLKKATVLEPSNCAAHWNLAVSYFSMQDFKSGWKHYESRWLLENMRDYQLKTKRKKWDFKKRKGTLLIWAEQGLGEQILYSRILTYLKIYPQKIVLALDKRLIPVYKKSFPEFDYIDRFMITESTFFEEQIPIGDLAGHFISTATDLRKIEFPYIKSSIIESQINRLEDERNFLICGISWQSSGDDFGDAKSIPFEEIIILLEINNIKWINLQYFSNKTDEEIINKITKKYKLKIENKNDNLNNLEGLSNLIFNCDYIVTCSNIVAHLAGAMNKETLLILPNGRGRLWFWNNQGDNSIWYPSIKFFKNNNNINWSKPIAEIKEYLVKNLK